MPPLGAAADGRKLAVHAEMSNQPRYRGCDSPALFLGHEEAQETAWISGRNYRRAYERDRDSIVARISFCAFLRPFSRLHIPFLVVPLLLFAVVSPARAAESGNSEEDRLRGALRETMLQLRSAQSELSTLQAAQAAAADEKKTLTEKYETLKKQAVSDRSATDKTVADFTARVADQKAAIAHLEAALEKSKAEGEQAAKALHAAEAHGAQLTTQNVALNRQISELQSKNLALFLLGNEILTRYEEFSLGNALSAKEPFVGKTRTKLENLVQAYQDKLLDQRAH